jgi:hypothetical protein
MLLYAGSFTTAPCAEVPLLIDDQSQSIIQARRWDDDRFNALTSPLSRQISR